MEIAKFVKFTQMEKPVSNFSSPAAFTPTHSASGLCHLSHGQCGRSVANTGTSLPFSTSITSAKNRSQKHLRAVRTSTLQDSQRGKPLEYDALTGAVLRAASRHGIPVPHMTAVHVLIGLLDQHCAML